MNFKFQKILTMRGLFVLIGSLSLLFPGYFSSDIIASVLSVVMVSLIIFGGAGVFIFGKYAEQKLTFAISAQQSDEKVRSGSIVLCLSPILILPMFYIRIIVEPQQADIEIQDGEISGRIKKLEMMPLTFVARHRGVWQIKTIKFEVRDALSLFTYYFRREVSLTLEVAPPIRETAPMELFAGTLSEGDFSPSPKARLGDEYDLKAYNPSDGVKKIAWRVFARKGELISRFPEDTSTPEGSTWVFVVATTFEDEVVTNALEYVRQAEERGLFLNIGFLGGSVIADSFESAKDLAINTAWSARDAEIIPSLKSFLSRHEQDVHTLVIFCDVNNQSGIQKIRETVSSDTSVVFYGTYGRDHIFSTSNSFREWLFEKENLTTEIPQIQKKILLQNFLKATEGCEVFVRDV